MNKAQDWDRSGEHGRSWFMIALQGATQVLDDYDGCLFWCSVPEGFVPEQEDGRAVLEVKKKVPPDLPAFTSCSESLSKS